MEIEEVPDYLIGLPPGSAAFLKAVVLDRLGHRAEAGDVWRAVRELDEQFPKLAGTLEVLEQRPELQEYLRGLKPIG